MAGATVPLGFPYPTDTDLVQNTDEAIQALAEAVDDYIDGTAWANVPLLNGWAVSAFGGQYRRAGRAVYLTGVFTKAAWAAGEVFGNLPAGFRPSRAIAVPAYSGHLFTIETNGNLVVQSASAGGGFWASAGFPL